MATQNQNQVIMQDRDMAMALVNLLEENWIAADIDAVNNKRVNYEACFEEQVQCILYDLGV